MIDVICQSGVAALAAAPLRDGRALTAIALKDCQYTDALLHDCYAPPDGDCFAPEIPPVLQAAEPLERLRPHPLLRMFALDDAYSVAYVPSLSAITVLDRAARDLLDRLPSDPRSLSSEEQAALQRLHQLRLVTAGTGQIAPPPDPTTLGVWLHITNACNLRCSYCYLQKSDEMISLDTARAAIDTAVRTALRHGYPRLALNYAGGEASLHMDLVEATHTYAQEQTARYGLHLQAGLLSNGTRLTSATLATIRRLGLRLMISLDGLATDHDANRPTLGGRGSAQATRAGIARALAAGVAPDIAITVSATNVDGLPALLRWLLERDLRFSISFYRQNDCSAGHDQLQLEDQRLIAGMRQAYAEIARNPPRWSLAGALLDRADLSHTHSRACAAGHSYLVIDQHGRIASCQMTLAQAVTNVSAADPLSQIRLDPRGVRSVPVGEKEACATCDWRYWCAGGCPVATFRASGRYDTRSPHCVLYQALYPDLIRLEGLRLLHWHQRSEAARMAIPA
jgi:uncharacterized protein